MKLRPFQQQSKLDVYAAWNAGHQNVCFVLPTGGGKTVLLADIVREHRGASCVIAHRSELVGQIALALARQGVKHRIIGPNSLVKLIVQEQMRDLGASWFDPNAPCAVAGVNTIINRGEQLRHWLPQVTLWVQDEVHHLIRKNVWGKAVAMFPNARGLGVTATPTRADGHGLGRHAQGVLDTIVEGPSMRWLIDEGYLTDYRIFCPPNDVKLDDVPITASGDFSPPKLKQAVRKSHIVGDVVQHYQRIGTGMLGVVFGTDVETATDLAKGFRDAGVKSEVITGTTPEAMRNELLQRFKTGQIAVLSSVDLFSEGFDLPALQIAHFARPTESYGVFAQQFGRAIRPMYAPGYPLDTAAQRLAAIAASPKPYAIICDHVGNVIRHGLPDKPRKWSLDAREKRSATTDDDSIPLRACAGCTRPYERFRLTCPYCGHVPQPGGRSRPEFVDGDLWELDAATLANMRAAVDHVDGDSNMLALKMQRAGASQIAVNGMLKQHGLRRDSQEALRAAITWWAGWQQRIGLSDRESHKRFYLTFGTDILTAQALGRPEAMDLASRINRHLGAHSNG